MALAERGVLLDHVGEHLHLLGGDAAEGQLHADHLHVGLALAVDALLEAEADELLLGLLAAEEAGGLGVEVVELALEDRDDVPGDVLVDLGVLERAALALAVLLLADGPARSRDPRAWRPGLPLLAGPFFVGVGDGLHGAAVLPSRRRRDLPGGYRLLNLANLIEFKVIPAGRRVGEGSPFGARPPRGYSAPCTARMLPAGSVNQAIPPPGPLRSMPFSSWSKPS